MTDDGPLIIAVVVTPVTTASTVFGLYDLFASAGRDWKLLTTGEPGTPRARPILVSSTTRPFEAANGVWLRAQETFESCPIPDIIFVPELLVAPDDPPDGRFRREAAWLTACFEQGAALASACSGALMLAEAGLLGGCEATTHWAYCDAMAERHPEINVQPNRFLVASGEGQRIITSGGGTSYQDLGLFLIARFFGADEAMQLAKTYLIDWHSLGQLPLRRSLVLRKPETDTSSGCKSGSPGTTPTGHRWPRWSQ